jgi:peptidoglycan/xylan/chitin deacetylase (PgdA/CDA1 family)
MYLPTGFIGDRRQLFSPTTTPHASRTAPPCLNWSEVRELHAAGIEFGSHTVNHPVLYELGWGDIRRELAESRDRLEQELGGSVNAFAYPFRFPAADRDFVVRFGDLLREAGYQSNVTTTIGRARQADPPLALPRLPMNRHDDTALLRSKLAGDYDWLSWPQAVKKRLQRRRALSRSDDVISK